MRRFASQIGKEGIGQRGLVAGPKFARHLNLQVMAFVEGGGGLRGIAFGDQVIGGRGGVGQHHIRLTLKEKAISFGPARGDGDDVVLQPGPDFGRTVAIGGLDPHHQPQTGGRGARVLNDDLQVGRGQLFKGFRRAGEGCVVHKGEPAPVKGQEIRVLIGGWQPSDGRLAMGGKQPGGGSLCGEVGVKTHHHIGGAGCTFKLQARQK